MTIFTHRGLAFVGCVLLRRPGIAALVITIAATTAVSAQQQSATYDVISSFDAPFIGGRAPTTLRQAEDGS
jgi:hypothetical protein